MVQFSEAKEIILQLKKVYKEKKLSIDKVLSLVNEQLGDGTVSRSTIQAVFADGSENGSRQFGFETTLKPLCIVLLDVEQIEENDSDDVRFYKSFLRLKKDLIEELKLEYAEKLQDETDRYQKSIEFKDHQIELKDQRIDELLAGWREMSATNRELTQTNNKLVHQLMDCPLRKQDGEGC